jgi:hypothetical protein
VNGFREVRGMGIYHCNYECGTKHPVAGTKKEAKTLFSCLKRATR